jgi:hypothetical protein
MKRSGRRAPAGDASDFTAADHLICTIVRQARNFPPAAGILRVGTDRAALEVVPARSHVGYRDKNGAMRIGTGIPGQDPPVTSVPETAGKPSAFPRSSRMSIFSVLGARRGAASVIAVSRADRSLVVLGEGIG